MKNLVIIFIFGLSLTILSCNKDKAAPVPDTVDCNTIQVSFANDIQPIFDNYCNYNGCHSASTQADGRVYETHGQIAADAEICYSAMNHEPGFTPMPLGNPTKLSIDILSKMNCWIQDGKPNN